MGRVGLARSTRRLLIVQLLALSRAPFWWALGNVGLLLRKNTIFCASNVVLVPSCLSIQRIEARQEPLVDRWAEELYWKRFQRKGLAKVTLQNGFTPS